LAPIQGFLAEEVIQNLTRARELCRVLNDDTGLVAVLINLGRAYDARSDRAVIEQLAAEELALLERVQEPALALQLHTHLGTSSFFRGVLAQAQEHHARVLELYDPRQHRDLFLHFGFDPAVTAGVNSSCSLWLAGWPDQARFRLQTALSWARELRHPFSLVHALIPGTLVRLWCGDLDDAGRLVTEGEQVASEYDIVLFSAVERIQQAYLEVHRGKAEVGLSLFTEGLAQYRDRSMGMRHLVPLSLCFMADAYRQMGRIEEGLATIAEAVHLTETQTSLFWAAEVYRLKGELTLQRERQKAKSKKQKAKVPTPNSQLPTPQSEAEACFLKALEIARQQGAKSLELRATMSLARLWQHQDKQHSARNTLSAIYGWFTEGFDTTDLQEAKALLDALRA
jgi:predicted ATPase